MTDIVERLRDASYENAPSRCMEAAREIERLRKVLTGIAEYCSGEDRTLGAVGRLASIHNTARQALRVLHPQS